MLQNITLFGISSYGNERYEALDKSSIEVYLDTVYGERKSDIMSIIEKHELITISDFFYLN